MIKNFLLLGAVCLLFTDSPLRAQNINHGVRLPHEKIIETHLKTDVEGSYPQHMEESYWLSDAWLPYATEDITYNDNGDILTVERADASGKTLETFEYNDLGWNIQSIVQIWVDNSWVNQTRNKENYDGTDYIGYTMENWIDGAWVLDEGMAFTLEKTNGRTDVVIIQSKRPGEDWANMQRYTYSYVGTSDLASSVIIEAWVNGEWVNSMKFDYTYDNNILAEYLMYNYNDGSWSAVTKVSYTYGDYDSMYMITQTLINDVWTPSSRTSYEYDIHGNATSEIVEFYSDGWAMAMGTQYLLSYDGNNLTQRVTQSYSTGDPVGMKGLKTGSWTNTLKEVFSDFNTAGVSLVTQNEINLSCFPIPANDMLYIKASNPEGERNIELSIYNIAGQVVYAESCLLRLGNQQLSIPVSNLERGSYILRIQAKNGASLLQEMIQKQ